jgi:hypothetical protein
LGISPVTRQKPAVREIDVSQIINLTVHGFLTPEQSLLLAPAPCADDKFVVVPGRLDETV